jgi:7-cyano-7-deazaguanine synthase
MNDTQTTSRALVLFSGGQDSTTCLLWALNRYDEVHTVGFNYGQRHQIEMQVRLEILNDIRKQEAWSLKLGRDVELPLNCLEAIGGNALTDDTEITELPNGLPSTFVPGRNILFLTAAAALAYRSNIHTLVGGMCETDYSGYPDCRAQTLAAIQTAIELGMDWKISIETPLMLLNKAETWGLALEEGGKVGLELVRTQSHTCYQGERDTLHPWGYGCDACPACELRRNGFEKWQSNSLASIN